MVYIGIDPGAHGGIAAIDGGVVRLFDTPTREYLSNGKTKRTLDAGEITTLLQGLGAQDDCQVTLERVQAMPGLPGKKFQQQNPGEERQTMGVTSAFNFGVGFGILIGVLSALRLPYQMVTPQVWKRAYGLRRLEGQTQGQVKEASRMLAIELFPQAADRMQRKRDEARAEALLLAEFGRRNWQSETAELPF